LPAHSLAANIV